ncbi:winged helix-turn-helix transcriptional regulator [Microbacterium resistens]|uniref:ArsR/SmtB family transcription factor n=1 Tax=Microbacterium resistens TaxID=156977 RepID=UPI001C57DC9F|nr:winged helix-turn-helix domain-containing protein [Microbacterium resistens]MBW1639023.1 winged helix-turn-helix transcriptional regulator [Microbacterium resistens]
MGGDDVEARLSALEQAVAELQKQSVGAEEQPNVRVAPDSAAEALWALEGLKARSPEGGAVLYTGAVDLPTGGVVQWQYGLAASAVWAQDWADLADALDALGHPVRLAILHAVLHGTVTASGLVEELESGTSGQVYHHLKELTTNGWLASAGRGAYEVPAARVVPLLAVLVAVGTPR